MRQQNILLIVTNVFTYLILCFSAALLDWFLTKRTDYNMPMEYFLSPQFIISLNVITHMTVLTYILWRRSKKFAHSFLKFITSMSYAIFLFVLIILASIFGSFFEQKIAELYFYKSLWFRVILVFIFSSTVYCGFTTHLPRKLRKIPIFMVHLGIPIIIIGGIVSSFGSDYGYMIISEKEGQSVAFRENDSTFTLPFMVYCNDFKIEYYDEKMVHLLIMQDKNGNNLQPIAFHPGPQRIQTPVQGYTIDILQHLTDFEVDPENKRLIPKGTEWSNPAVVLQVGDEVGTKLAKFPEFNEDKIWNGYKIFYTVMSQNSGVKDYYSDLSIVESEQDGDYIVKEKTIQVNDALSYKGYKFYQASYDEKEFSWTGLIVKKDPGTPIVYIGSFILVAGFFSLFYMVMNRERKKEIPSYG